MTLPLTRRIARAALLVAAGAAPVVGAAGSASALDHSLAPTGALSGVSSLDGAGVGNTVDGASKTATGLAGDKTVGKAVDRAGKTATPTAQKAAGSAGEILGETAGAATESTPATDGLGEGVPSLGGLPIGG
ncbi:MULTISPECIES: ATP-binding protein [Streptomyces]|uniref:ATP-binding protein n=1 Tax=Streptomyces TaxID=1883 RepID=UPI0013184EC2|nr:MULTISPECIES: ATP-binding protein [Streptomyces]QGZ50826.1 ATP-binding protein [Streptomyces sp. QHH-9511]GGT82297.1 ATP-binding protein [Streptomyces lateritius]